MKPIAEYSVQKSQIRMTKPWFVTSPDCAKQTAKQNNPTLKNHQYVVAEELPNPSDRKLIFFKCIRGKVLSCKNGSRRF